MKQICIIGCGYIGSAIAKLWSQKGYSVTATTRHTEKLDFISEIAAKGFLFKGDEEELASLIALNEVFLVSIAPDNFEQYAKTYLHLANLFRELALETNQPRTLFYTSSTAVYGDHHGQWVDETSTLLGKSDQAKILIETEQVYHSLEELGWNCSIFRLAEIYGPGREISARVKQLEGHKMPGSGALYTNMVHRDDIVKALDYALYHELDGIYNLADDDHPIRSELYNTVAKKHHLPAVEWDPSLPSLRSDNKRVSNHKIKSEGFSFSYPHRVLD